MYVCKVRLDWRAAKNLTQGLQYRSQDVVFGTYVEGSDTCVDQAGIDRPADSREIRILRNPI